VAEQEANVLRIGFCSYAMTLGLGDAISAFRARYPDVQLILDDLPAPDQLQRISRGRLDVAICTAPLLRPEIGTVALGSERLVGLVPPIRKSPLPTPVRLADYARLPFIALDRETYGEFWRYLDQLCQERGVSLEPAHEVKEKHSLLALVAGGMGVSIMPAHIAETARGSLRILPIEDLPNEIEIVAAFDTSASNGMRDYFLDLLKEAAAARRVDLVSKKIPTAQRLSAAL
jgi:DNA-binding transcriptional LysR family regulator